MAYSPLDGLKNQGAWALILGRVKHSGILHVNEKDVLGAGSYPAKN